MLFEWTNECVKRVSWVWGMALVISGKRGLSEGWTLPSPPRFWCLPPGPFQKPVSQIIVYSPKVPDSLWFPEGEKNEDSIYHEIHSYKHYKSLEVNKRWVLNLNISFWILKSCRNIYTMVHDIMIHGITDYNYHDRYVSFNFLHL